VKPLLLGPNQFPRFYRGGPAIARLRGLGSGDDYQPEDWVGSTTTTWGARDEGLTRLEDGRTLRDAMAKAPEAFLGPEHVERFGPEPALLVKLLDAGERLPVHFHPGRSFAARHLGSSYGKTEAWFVVSARPGAEVGFGWTEEMASEVVVSWVENQEVEAMLAALRWVSVAAGDALFVPAGTVHAIGEGILIVELQEPTDLSVLMEWKGFAIDGARLGHLGLGFDVALSALDRSAMRDADLARLRRGGDGERPGRRSLFPPEADAFFRAERIAVDGGSSLAPSFSLLVVLEGSGVLVCSAGDEVGLRRGATVLVPYAAGECRIEGALDVIRCMPPRPSSPSVR
jgi:mannose-6-phosphate isomerase